MIRIVSRTFTLHGRGSCQGEKKTINELAQHLKWCIGEEKKWEIPPEPKVELPQKPNMAMLGTPAADVDQFDAKYDADEEAVRKDADRIRKEREARGDKSLYSMLQSWFAPKLEDIIISQKSDTFEGQEVVSYDIDCIFKPEL